jgi:hypothetical protein
MALTPKQLAAADEAIAHATAEALREMGIRLTMSAISHGPLAKGELHLYSPASTWSPPAIETYNKAPTQARTVQWAGILSLKDLRSTQSARDMAERVIGLLEGVAPFGLQPSRIYDGRIYPRSVQLARENQPDNQRQSQGPEARRWIYALTLECQINNPLPPL